MSRPAPQMPEGRRPTCIQSRFMRDTSRSAVMATWWEKVWIQRSAGSGLGLHRKYHQ